MFYTENPDRDIRKINVILSNIETDFQQLQKSFGTIATVFEEKLNEKKNSTTDKICKGLLVLINFKIIDKMIIFF